MASVYANSESTCLSLRHHRPMALSVHRAGGRLFKSLGNPGSDPFRTIVRPKAFRGLSIWEIPV